MEDDELGEVESKKFLIFIEAEKWGNEIEIGMNFLILYDQNILKRVIDVD